MRLTSSPALALTLLALLSGAHAFNAYSGSHCDGDMGAQVGCDGSCHSFAGRHSYTAGYDNRCVSLWSGAGCTGQRFNYTKEGIECRNVNTGTNIQSFRCWVGNGSCK